MQEILGLIQVLLRVVEVGSIFLLISPLYYKQTIIFYFCSFTLSTNNVIVYNEVKNRIFFLLLNTGTYYQALFEIIDSFQ